MFFTRIFFMVMIRQFFSHLTISASLIVFEISIVALFILYTFLKILSHSLYRWSHDYIRKTYKYLMTPIRRHLLWQTDTCNSSLSPFLSSPLILYGCLFLPLLSYVILKLFYLYSKLDIFERKKTFVIKNQDTLPIPICL